MRTLIEELQTLFDVFIKDQSTSSKEGLKKKKNKKIDEEKRKQFLDLADSIDGMQELMEDPQRVLVCDGGGIVLEDQRVHLYLTNDFLLIVGKKKRQNTATKHFILNAIDLKDAVVSGFNREFEISVHGESFVFKADDEETRKFWLGVLEPLLIELSVEKNSDDFDVSSQKTKASQNVSEELIVAANELMNSLEEAVAQCDYDSAIDLIIKIKSEIQDVREDWIASFKHKPNAKIDQLKGFIEHELSSPLVSKILVNLHVQRLFKLGLESYAREIFLSSRSRFLRQKVKKLKYEGSLVQFSTEISMLVFTIIKSTCEWYSNAFQDKSVAAGFVEWAVEEVKQLGNILRKQLFQPSIEFSVINECIKSCKSHSRMVLMKTYF